MAKKNETAELREKTDEELGQELDEAYRNLFTLRFKAATRQLERHQSVSEARKRIARLKTLQTQRRLGIQ
jgi:large subunit ribosomal protein L29